MHTLILNVLAILAVANARVAKDFPCYDGTWKYSKLSGNCYKILQTNTKKSWSQARDACKAALQSAAPNVSVRLPKFTSEEDVLALIQVMNDLGNREKVWIGAKRPSQNSPFTYDDETKPAKFEYFTWSDGNGPGDCIQFLYTYKVNQGGTWSGTRTIENVSCAEERVFICEHSTKPCENPPGNFNTNLMVFDPIKPFVQTTVEARCKEGFYLKEDKSQVRKSGSNVDNDLTKYKYSCGGTRKGGVTTPANPDEFVTSFKYSGYDIPGCEGITCQFFSKLVVNVDTVFDKSHDREYDFGDVINLECSKGFVSSKDKSTHLAKLRCSQSIEYPSNGEWDPQDLRACTVLRCDAEKLTKMLPNRAHFVSARNLVTELVYSKLERNQFNRYANVVKIKCNPGYFFSDRTTVKNVKCTIKENTKSEGQWVGYGGTGLPLPDSCISVNCLNDNILVKPEMHIELKFKVTYLDQTKATLSKHAKDSYKFGVKIEFDCKEDYETVNQASSQVLTCDNSGTWTPKLTSCLAKTKNINTTQGSRYTPPPVEAESAQQVGSFVIGLIFTFFALILFLDLTTIKRDFRMMRNNIRLQRRRIRKYKEKRKRRKEKMSANSQTEEDEEHIAASENTENE